MFRLFLALSLFLMPLYGGEYPLLKRLEKAKIGDFTVFEANKTITLLVIRHLSRQSVVLEEISAPSSKVKPGAWSAWIQSKAPGHTSWSMIEMDLLDQSILECYSFNKNAWLPQSPQDNFLATLFHLSLTPVDVTQRRKVGPAPHEGEIDRRKTWNPPLIIEGKKTEHSSFDVFEANWPDDRSELSGKNICLYFDREARTALPSWIQVDTGQVTASLRAIDSGHRLPSSSYRSMPRRVPEFIGSPIKTKNGLRLLIKSPKYYKSFELFAIDITNKEKQIHLISHSITEGKGGILNLDIDAEELIQNLQPDHKYTWLIVPPEHSESYSEMQRLFLWK
jgi:hypothetical protein